MISGQPTAIRIPQSRRPGIEGDVDSAADAVSSEDPDVRTRSRAALAVLIFAALPGLAHAQGVILFVRHAEKADASADTPLSAAGEARARSLADHLEKAGITAIFTSEFQRTIKTAEPLAKRIGIDPIVVPGKDLDALVARLRERKPDEIVLVVGHSNTIPELIKRLGYPGEITIADDAYGDLFVVVPRQGGAAALIRLGF
jgi:phosphohistidine phosphatase SixA